MITAFGAIRTHWVWPLTGKNQPIEFTNGISTLFVTTQQVRFRRMFYSQELLDFCHKTWFSMNIEALMKNTGLDLISSVMKKGDSPTPLL